MGDRERDRDRRRDRDDRVKERDRTRRSRTPERNRSRHTRSPDRQFKKSSKSRSRSRSIDHHSSSSRRRHHHRSPSPRKRRRSSRDEKDDDNDNRAAAVLDRLCNVVKGETQTFATGTLCLRRNHEHRGMQLSGFIAMLSRAKHNPSPLAPWALGDTVATLRQPLASTRHLGVLSETGT
ncbi:hypothetical protein IFM89_012411 [Coptis chinensis]|uniref:Uncharacterized protein n=1 Tax=Coptis chinensis TaxID=261450 RepID=A0A835IC79_9MAGN|nr:hypothetical protein IFM89_012411 [Coptis chinensis]